MSELVIRPAFKDGVTKGDIKNKGDIKDKGRDWDPFRKWLSLIALLPRVARLRPDWQDLLAREIGARHDHRQLVESILGLPAQKEIAQSRRNSWSPVV